MAVRASNSQTIELNTEDIKDPIAEENFQRIQEQFRNDLFGRGEWHPYELTFEGGVTKHKYQHRLTFRPLDIIQTGVNPSTVNVTFHPEDFNTQFLVVSVSAACKLRFFAGRYFQDRGA